MKISSSRLEFVFKDFPDLSPLGFASGYAFAPWRWTEAAIQAEIHRGQAWLRSPAGLNQLSFVAFLFEDISKTETIQARPDSYSLKNLIETNLRLPAGSIAHGSLIAAAVLRGFAVKRCELNAFFNMSLKSLKKRGFINA